MYVWRSFACHTFGLKSLIKDATCYKNPENLNSIDFTIRNNSRSFRNFCVIKTDLLDFHRMVVTVTKTLFERSKPTVTEYRGYNKYFENILFRELLCELSNVTLEENANGFEEFTPNRQKYVQYNHPSFMNKTF